jgi:hypothetical protein
MSGEKNTAFNRPSFSIGERFKVMNRKEMDVRRVVPFIGKQLGLRRPSGPQVREPDAPMAEVGKSHDGAPSDTQHLTQDF